MAETEDPLVFAPTLREVMLRPRWLGLLALCLVVAGVFAWLGQWQLSRAIDNDPLPAGVTERARQIDDVVAPGEYLNEPLVGQRVSVSGEWVAGDFIVVDDRFNDGVEGYWVTGQFRVAGGDRPASLAVAIGWTASREEAAAAADALDGWAESAPPAEPIELTGRLISDEGVEQPPADDLTRLDRMSPAALLNRWHDVDGIAVYRPYLTSADPGGGVDGGVHGPELTAISSPAPELAGPVNWLNVFYAAEWAVFAGFAFYLWYRLARDARERELEELEGTAED